MGRVTKSKTSITKYHEVFSSRFTDLGKLRSSVNWKKTSLEKEVNMVLNVQGNRTAY